MIEPLKDRVAAQIAAEPDDNGCLNWRGLVNDSGYGRIGYRSRMLRVHRLVWLWRYGAIPEGMCVLHRCDNRLCVNAEHLFLGTNADNMRDRNAKQRQAKGVRNGQAKLTPADVAQIRLRYRKGVLGVYVLGREFGVSPSTIRRVITGEQWNHV